MKKLGVQRSKAVLGMVLCIIETSAKAQNIKSPYYFYLILDKQKGMRIPFALHEFNQEIDCREFPDNLHKIEN